MTNASNNRRLKSDDRTINLLGALVVALGDTTCAAVEDASGHGITASAALTTAAAYPGESVDALRRTLGLSAAGGTRLVDGLQADGLVERRASLEDRRSRAVVLTDAGREHAHAVLTARHAVLSRALAPLWGFGIVVAKAALDGGVPPLALVTIQLAASVAVFSTATLITAPRIVWPPRRRAGVSALSGVLEYGTTYALAAFGLALTTAGNAAIIGATEPALIVLAAALILGERAGRKLLVLLAVVTTGLVLVVLPDLASAGALAWVICSS